MIRKHFPRKRSGVRRLFRGRGVSGRTGNVVLAVATSIDALAVGITFAFLRVNIWAAVSFIGVITFLLSTAGVKVGNVFGVKYKSRAELAGGVILILLGLKFCWSTWGFCKGSARHFLGQGKACGNFRRQGEIK